MNYNRQLVLGFAAYARNNFGELEGLLNTFIEEMEKPNPKPEPEVGVCLQVLESAAEMTGVTMDELSSGKKYGSIPSCKQICAQILHELKCSDETIASNLPQMGTIGSIRSRREAAVKYQKVEKNYRQVLNQLRERFGIAIPVVLRD